MFQYKMEIFTRREKELLSPTLWASTVSCADFSCAQERQEGGGQSYPIFRSYLSMSFQYSKDQELEW